MLRSLLIYLSQAEWMRRRVMGMKIARKVALRFVAGESLEQAIDVVKSLNAQSMLATMDQLGEHTKTVQQAKETTGEIKKILAAIEESGVHSGLSVKLSQLGLLLDEALCAENLREILEQARQFEIFVRIDMEDSPCVDATLAIFRKMRDEYGFENVGVVLQSALYRSLQDTDVLLEGATRIRLVKGAYLEPPEIAYAKKTGTDQAFDVLTRKMLDAAKKEANPKDGRHGPWPPITAVGSHDEVRINRAIAYAQEIGVPKERVEIQMLFGIRRELQRALTDQGYPVRIYVPFGTEWYPYFMRRLAERPANLWFFISSLFRK